jgi:ribosomal protein S18 acetylase RimI-like enzyme
MQELSASADKRSGPAREALRDSVEAPHSDADLEVQDVAPSFELVSRSAARREPARPAERLTSVRRAVPGDAASLAKFGARTFRETFEADNTPEDMELYLASAYGEHRQAAELRSAEMVTLLAEDGRRLAGFAQLREGPAPECVEGRAPIELVRFYVDRAWQGRGVAQALMMETLQAASDKGARTVWLSVWERNYRAQAFYRKCGFEDCGAREFILGRDRQTDRVMTRTLSGAP